MDWKSTKRKCYELLIESVCFNVTASYINWNFCKCFVLAATVCSSLSNLEGEETFEATMLGQAEEVVQERVCDDELILIKK